MKKHSFTLLEVLISLSLLSILLFALFSSYWQHLKTGQALSQAKERILARALVEAKLAPLLANALPPLYSGPSPEGDGPALFFSYENQIDPDPHFIGQVASILYVDSKGCLTLLTSRKGHARQERLCEKMPPLTLSFFEGVKWVDQWPKENKQPPSMCKILDWLFFLNPPSPILLDS